jgi:hypothetical protein
MMDDERTASKTSEAQRRAQALSWWMLAKALACQLGAREVLALVDKELIEVGRGGTVAAECFHRLRRRALLPSVAVEEAVSRSASRQQSEEQFRQPTANGSDGSSSDDDDPSSDGSGIDDRMRAWLTATAARQTAIGAASVRCAPSFRRHRGLPPGPLPARRLTILETESRSSAGVALALFASMGSSIAAAMTETITRQSRDGDVDMWVRPAALKCLAQAEELAACVVAVEDSFATAHEETYGLAAVSANPKHTPPPPLNP